MRDPFLAAIRAHPDDDATPLVYADWLDDQDDDARAAFLRLQQRARTLTHEDEEFEDLLTQMRGLVEQLPRRWLNVVNRPRLLGSVWSGPDSKSGYYIFRFEAKGILCYSSNTGTYRNGTWKQVGPLVWMETNRHYADYEGQIAGDRILGTGSNISGLKWTWDVIRTTEKQARTDAPYHRRVETLNLEEVQVHIYPHGRPRRQRRRSGEPPA